MIHLKMSSAITVLCNSSFHPFTPRRPASSSAAQSGQQRERRREVFTGDSADTTHRNNKALLRSIHSCRLLFKYTDDGEWYSRRPALPWKESEVACWTASLNLKAFIGGCWNKQDRPPVVAYNVHIY